MESHAGAVGLQACGGNGSMAALLCDASGAGVPRCKGVDARMQGVVGGKEERFCCSLDCSGACAVKSTHNARLLVFP